MTAEFPAEQVIAAAAAVVTGGEELADADAETTAAKPFLRMVGMVN